MNGNSRIIISVAKNVLNEADEEPLLMKEGDKNLELVHWSRLLTADSTLADLMNELPFSLDDKSLFDCTFHPPKEFFFSKENNQLKGPNSVTLQSLGWFPSGTIVILLKQDIIAHRTVLLCQKLSTLELGTFQDASPTYTTSAAATANRLLPSQLLAAVEQRFQREEEEVAYSSNNISPPRKKQQTPDDQQAKLKKMIQRLDEKQMTDNQKSHGKMSNINSQVRCMLIKSRSVPGIPIHKNHRPEDRFFLEVILEDDTVTSVSSYFYFYSQMTTVGKVATTASSANKEVECLVEKDATFWRLPNTMTLSECQNHNYLQPFDRVVIHPMTSTNGTSTPSILEWKKSEEEKLLMESNFVDNTVPIHSTLPTCTGRSNISITEDDATSEIPITDQERNRVSRIEKAIQSINEDGIAKSSTGNKKTNSTKKTTEATMEKLRQMKIKSRAKGDAQKINLEDRLYLHVILFLDYDNRQEASSFSQFYSVSKGKAMDIITSCSFPQKLSSELLIAHRADILFYKIPSEMTLKDASEYLLPYSQVIVRIFCKEQDSYTERQVLRK